MRQTLGAPRVIRASDDGRTDCFAAGAESHQPGSRRLPPEAAKRMRRPQAVSTLPATLLCAATRPPLQGGP